MSALERRYRRLLNAYPRAYRNERGGELLDTLLESAPDGRTWPAPREAAALIAGGLRVRSGLSEQLSLGRQLRMAVAFGLALYIGVTALAIVTNNLSQVAVPHRDNFSWPWVASGILSIAFVASTWLARPAVVTSLAVIAAAADINAFAMTSRLDIGRITLDLLVYAALAVAAVGGPRMPTHWLAFAGIASLYFVVPLTPFGTRHAWLLAAVAIAAVLWTWVDARPALALVTWFAIRSAYQFANGHPISSFELWEPRIPVYYAAILMIPAIWRLRRQALR